MKQYTLLTASGINKLLKTASDGSKIALKEVVVSDYDGELSEQTTSIPNEKYRGAINAITIDENDNNILDVDAIIPPEVGGFYIKTAGIYCDDGSLFAVARLADTYKPLLNEGSSKDITLNFKLQIANANESIILKVDNNVALATRKWSENQFLKKTDKIDAYTKAQSDEKFWSDIKVEFKNEPNGYVKLPNGLIIQWGCTDNPKADSGAVVNDKKTMHFPIAFPNRCLLVNLSDTLGWASETTYIGAMITAFDNSSFTFYNDWDDFNYTSYSTKYSIPFPNGFYHYIAIGY